jgi:hypothetical protein
MRRRDAERRICDRYICARHRRAIGQGGDLCPEHARASTVCQCETLTLLPRTQGSEGTILPLCNQERTHDNHGRQDECKPPMIA